MAHPEWVDLQVAAVLKFPRRKQGLAAEARAQVTALLLLHLFHCFNQILITLHHEEFCILPRKLFFLVRENERVKVFTACAIARSAFEAEGSFATFNQ